jgi:nucleoside permease NupC
MKMATSQLGQKLVANNFVGCQLLVGQKLVANNFVGCQLLTSGAWDFFLVQLVMIFNSRVVAQKSPGES